MRGSVKGNAPKTYDTYKGLGPALFSFWRLIGTFDFKAYTSQLGEEDCVLTASYFGIEAG